MDREIVRQILEKKESFLRRHLILSSFTINELYKGKVISLLDKFNLQEHNPHEQLSTVFSILRECGLDVFSKFLFTLQRSFDRWIADSLLDTKITFTQSVPIIEEKTLREYLREQEKKSRKFPVPEVPVPRRRSEPPYKWHSRRFQTVRLELPKSPYLPKTRSHDFGVSKEHKFQNSPPSRADLGHVTRQVHHLHQVFDVQKRSNEKTISILKQKQKAIADILTKNLDEQRLLERNQQTIFDITKRLDAIYTEAGQLLKPQQSRHVTQARLGRLQDVILFNDRNSS